MSFHELMRPDPESVGTSGLVLFGGDLALAYLRDGNTTSYPYHFDIAGGAKIDGETPFDTFNRELQEEFGLDVEPEQITYAKRGESLLGAPNVGWFVVAVLDESERYKINFGDEGLFYIVTRVDALLKEEALIPQRRQKIQEYLAHIKSSQKTATL